MTPDEPRTNPDPGGIDPTTTPPDPDAVVTTGFEVQELHDPVIQEHIEPRDGFEPVPVWLLLIFGGLLMWGGYYLGVNNGGFSPLVPDRDNPPVVAPGRLPLATPATTPTTLPK